MWIQGIGLATPRCSIDRQAAVGFAKTMLPTPEIHARSLEALYRISGVERRGSVLLAEDATGGDVPGEPVALPQTFYPPADCQRQRGPGTAARNARFAAEALPLGHRAAAAALRHADTAADAVTHLIVVTCTGFSAPGLDIGLIETLRLPAETQRVQVGFMGCHAAINALRVARGLVAAEPQAVVLLVCVELCTLHYQYGWVTDRVVSNAIFADGAAALVLAADAPVDSSPGDWAAPAGRSHLPQLVATGSRLIAQSQQAMTWQIGDHGFEMTLSAEVPQIIRRHLGDYLCTWLGRHDLQVNQIAGWAIHPGGPRILRAVQEALGLSDADVQPARTVLAQHGNMSSPTMLFILDQFVRQQRPLPWLMLGFGPGLEVEVALLR